MTKFHLQPQNQSPEGQGFRRSNSIGGITKLTRRRIRRQQRRSIPYPVVFSPARSHHVSFTRGHCLPSSECTHVLSETPRGVENSSRGRCDVSDFCSDDRLNLSWAVTDVSTPQGRKLVIKRCDAVANRETRPKENVPLATRHLKNSRRRKRLVSVRQNYPDKISSSDESVEESVEECALGRPCHEGAPLTPLSSKDENRFDRDFLLAKNDVSDVGIAASESDVTATDCRRLRREDTLILDHDDTNDGVRGGQAVTNSVTKPVTNPVTSLEYDSLFDVLDHGASDHQNDDVLRTSSERFSYKTLLRPVEHFRCVLCDTNLEALTLGTASLDILDMSRFHLQDGRSEVTLFCPECGFSQIGYR